MKKFLFILLMGALALPMMSQSKVEEAAYRSGFRSTTKVVAHKTFERQHINVTLRGDVPEGFASVTLAAGDVWQDGSGYQMLMDADVSNVRFLMNANADVAEFVAQPGSKVTLNTGTCSMEMGAR